MTEAYCEHTLTSATGLSFRCGGAAPQSMRSSAGHPVADRPLRGIVSWRIAGRAVRACGWHSWAMTAFLDDALAVIRAAALLSGDLRKAACWYFADSIDVFDGLTAEALVLQGRARDVLRYIESLEAGFSG